MRYGYRWYDKDKRIRIVKVPDCGTIHNTGRSINGSRYAYYGFKIEYLNAAGGVIADPRTDDIYDTMEAAKDMAKRLYPYWLNKYGASFLTYLELQQEAKAIALEIHNKRLKLNKVRAEIKRRKNEA